VPALRNLGIIFLVVGGMLLAFGIGASDEWVHDNVSCGNRYARRTCAPGEAQSFSVLAGAIFTAISLVMLFVSPRVRVTKPPRRTSPRA
jgi:hypothetical protein